MIRSKYLKSLKTPLYFYQTRKGTLLHLTPENQSFFELGAVILSLGDFVKMDDVFSLLPENKLTVKKFLGLEKKLCFLTPIDSMRRCVEGINKTNAVKISTIKGFEELSIDDFHSLVQLIKPDVLVGLTEEPGNEGSGVKSHKRCMEKSLRFLDETLMVMKKEYECGNMEILAPVHVGKFDDKANKTEVEKTKWEEDQKKYEEFRRNSIKEFVKRNGVKGAVIYGLCVGESFEERSNRLRSIISEIPEEKIDNFLLVLHSKGEPVDILHGLSLGIDCFEVDYPFNLAEKGHAFNFQEFDFMKESMESKEDKLKEINFEKKKAKFIDLNKTSFEMDKGPIEERCLCYSCKNHTRAYVHHLLKAKEMTANVLLTIHNVHCFEKFFMNVRSSISLKVFPQYISWFLQTQT